MLPGSEVTSRSSFSSQNSRESIDLTAKELLGHLADDRPHDSKSVSVRKRSLADHAILLATVSLVSLSLLLSFRSLFLASQHADPKFYANYSVLNTSDQDGITELAHHGVLPEEPSPLVVADDHGNQNWTVWILHSQDFPLTQQSYAELCSSVDLTKQYLDDMSTGSRAHQGHHHHSYYYQDERYMDIEEAERLDLLPASQAASTDSIVPAKGKDADALPPCGRTLIFVLEAANPGLGSTLMALWMSYGLAVREGRAFFIDDRYWAYGLYTNYFTPPPDPGCLPPPDSHRVPCPRHAAHLLVPAATQTRMFGHAFGEEFEDPREAGVARQTPIFGLLRTGYEALFKLKAEDEQFVAQRVPDAHQQQIVGLHVRHGDRHPWEFQYQKSYLPLHHYVDAAIYNASRIFVASDDPAISDAPELAAAEPAQDQASLSEPIFAAARANWTGGFTTDAFWQMGGINLKNATRQEVSKNLQRLRQLVARSYVLDLAVLSRTDQVVCAVSSVACRLLAVMMGWDQAIERGRWTSVDGDFDWTGIRW